MVITSVNNKYVKYLMKLRDKKYRDINGLFLVETVHLVNEAIKSGNVVSVIVSDGFEFECDIDKVFVSDFVMRKLCSTETNPKVMAVVKKKMELNNYGNKIIILDNIQDPGNLGTIIRSAVAFNFDTIVLSNDSVDLYNSKVVRSSEGMLFHINIVRKDLVSFINNIKSDYYEVIGTDVNGGSDVRNILSLDKYAVVIGNEGNGISDAVKRLCDKNIYIGINDRCESLNAGVAASIIMYVLNSR